MHVHTHAHASTNFLASREWADVERRYTQYLEPRLKDFEENAVEDATGMCEVLDWFQAVYGMLPYGAYPLVLATALAFTFLVLYSFPMSML